MQVTRSHGGPSEDLALAVLPTLEVPPGNETLSIRDPSVQVCPNFEFCPITLLARTAHLTVRHQQQAKPAHGSCGPIG